MASLTIRTLDELLKVRLRIRAARNERSIEAEVCAILQAALAEEQQPATDLGETIRQRFAVVGGVDLPPIEHEPSRTPPSFAE
jgi:antitoxin FitA